MPHIPSNPSLADMQEYVRKIDVERGFGNEDITSIGFHFTEEVGELFQAIRKKNKERVEEEFADVFTFLLSLANHENINLEQVFRAKEEINNKRSWHKAN